MPPALGAVLAPVAGAIIGDVSQNVQNKAANANQINQQNASEQYAAQQQQLALQQQQAARLQAMQSLQASLKPGGVGYSPVQGWGQMQAPPTTQAPQNLSGQVGGAQQPMIQPQGGGMGGGQVPQWLAQALPALLASGATPARRM